MNIPIFQVDAFSGCLFKGNPAAVCFLKEWIPDALMQKIARENNLSETAFFVESGNRFHIRWFTPYSEIELCGHATLATAHVLYHHLGYGERSIHFHSASGELTVSRSGPLIVLDFPARPAAPAEAPVELIEALGEEPLEVYLGRDYMLVYEHERIVAGLQPDFRQLARHAAHGVIVTAPGENSDFVSRFFAPAIGINEDPVTGSSHTVLIPYWSERLGWKDLSALQLSDRGGELFCEDLGERVLIKGRAVTFMKGEILMG
ncbi:MAG TPA: PhzF family phenazine biosynthesis protein [Bacteroidales bacterium]|nr:PhzF family phenazine biosynthesis protein [Bacteroidales bacterium]HRZ76196.1 PhzF family phenazine biosynthesis protein [Bacteroidales bacterium]